MRPEFRSDDRVLLLAIPSQNELAMLARLLVRGVLVAIGTREEVDQARAAFADFDNAMFLEARPDQIPWKDSYFSKILVPPYMEGILRSAAPELHRVLAPGGDIVTQRADA